jgi:transcriptional regulator GlxA family with amidase domain
MSPIEYLHTMRVEEAKHMLEAGDQRIEMIALDLGYEDASFFRRLFRRRVGMTPSEYRKRFMGIRKNLQKAAEPVSEAG